MMRREVFLMRYFPMRPPIVSLGLLRDSRTQGWGATKFISEEIRGQGRGGGIERKLIYVSF
jgi:hypothetical protein